MGGYFKIYYIIIYIYMPSKNNHSHKKNESSSLISIKDLTSNSSFNSSSKSCSTSLTHNSSSSDTSESTSHSESGETSSQLTYSDKSSVSCCAASTSSECSTSESVKSCNVCENLGNKQCKNLVKKYACAKNELLAISDIMIMFNFIKSKLQAVQPNIYQREFCKHSVNENINWLENFIDTLFCVLRKNEAYKIIKVKDCKLKNDDDVVSSRTYLIKISYKTKTSNENQIFPLILQWPQLTFNDAKSFARILDYTINDINTWIKNLQASSTLPFLN